MSRISTIKRELSDIRKQVDQRQYQAIDVSHLSAQDQVAAYLQGRCSDIDLSDEALGIVLYIAAMKPCDAPESLLPEAVEYVRIQTELAQMVTDGVQGAWLQYHEHFEAHHADE